MSTEKQDEQQSAWEDEGGATAPEPKQKTPKGLEIPIPKRSEVMDVLRWVIKPRSKR